MPLDDFVAQACAGTLSFAGAEAHCGTCGQSLPDFCDSLAVRVAESYLSGRIDYDAGDAAMNTLFAVMASESFLAATDRAIPEKAFAIYKAFDDGEYFREGDAPTDIPHEKYTRPRLLAILGPQRAF